jgi:hypothetical protein
LSATESRGAAEAAARLAQPKAMRRGSLSERFVKCSKPGCGCASDPKARHGPYYSLTRAVGGRTQSRFLTPQQAEIARRQIEAGHEFRQQVDAYWKLCEQWADQQREQTEAASPEAAQEGALGRLPSRGCPGSRPIDWLASPPGGRLRSAGNSRPALCAAPGGPRPGAARCACGQSARYAGRRSKVFQSALGELKLERAYYHCADCGRGSYPRDRQLGLENSSLSPAVVRMVASVAAAVSFQEGSQLLEQLAGVSVEAKQVERIGEALGAEIAAAEKAGPNYFPAQK